MLWAEKRLVSAKHSSSCKHFILQHCYLNQYMKFNRIYIEIGLKTFILCFFFFVLLHQHSPPLSYSFAVAVERQLSVESIFHRFQFHPKEICKAMAIFIKILRKISHFALKSTLSHPFKILVAHFQQHLKTFL